MRDAFSRFEGFISGMIAKFPRRVMPVVLVGVIPRRKAILPKVVKPAGLDASQYLIGVEMEIIF